MYKTGLLREEEGVSWAAVAHHGVLGEVLVGAVPLGHLASGDLAVAIGIRINHAAGGLETV